MTKRDKRLEQLCKNPKNVSFDELRQVIQDQGFDLKRSSGSHHLFEAQFGEKIWQLVIPLKKPHVKAVYVKEALQAIDEIIEFKAEQESEEEENGNTDD